MQTALIVDDSALARLTLKRYLEKYDMDVFEAECVADCRSWLLHNQMPDVVFMDISMPGADGFEGLAEIRADVNTKDLPVIMYSGDATDQAKAKARDCGATGFLRKPVNEAHLKKLLERLDKLVGEEAGAAPEPQPEAVAAKPAVEVIPRDKPEPVVASAVPKQELQDLRNSINHINIALERQQDELSSARTMIQRQANDMAHLQSNLEEQTRRLKMVAIMGMVATLAALIGLFAALLF